MKSSTKDRVYWDSCVFIDVLKKTPDRFPILATIVGAAEAGNLVIVTSTITIAEVLRTDPDIPLTAGERALIESYFRNPYIEWVEASQSIMEKARALVWDWNIRSLDGIHVASALFAGVPVMHTFDGAGKKRSGKLIPLNGKIGDPPVKIEVPSLGDDNALFKDAVGST